MELRKMIAFEGKVVWGLGITREDALADAAQYTDHGSLSVIRATPLLICLVEGMGGDDAEWEIDSHGVADLTGHCRRAEVYLNAVIDVLMELDSQRGKTALSEIEQRIFDRLDGAFKEVDLCGDKPRKKIRKKRSGQPR